MQKTISKVITAIRYLNLLLRLLDFIPTPDVLGPMLGDPSPVSNRKELGKSRPKFNATLYLIFTFVTKKSVSI